MLLFRATSSSTFIMSDVQSIYIPSSVRDFEHRQTVFFQLVDPMDKNKELNKPRHVQYMHKAWKRHQNAVYGVEINLALRKCLKIYQTRSNAIIFTIHFQPIVSRKLSEWKLEKVFMSPRPPPKISLKHEWKRDLRSEHAQRSEVWQLSRSFQSNQPIPNPSHDRTVQPVVKTDRTGQPVVETHTENVPEGSQTRSCHESISFKIGDGTIHD